MEIACLFIALKSYRQIAAGTANFLYSNE